MKIERKGWDPNNVYLVRDVASVSNIFIVGNGVKGLYGVKDVPHGNLTRLWYSSPRLNTFYLLHGRRNACVC
ncbi:MAG: hypothetical protein LBD89_08070 [Tannerellaceae bacterium]|nr:hypothetical protein [Tannerellaceae bacterium]